MLLTRPPLVEAEMVIRRPVHEVFSAFVDPGITTKFWFTRSSSPLTAGAKVTWWWDMYGVSTEVSVLQIEQDRRIVIEWDEPPTRVEWGFQARPDGATRVHIRNSGFSGDGDAAVTSALDAMGGFALVLAGLKAWLEYGVRLRLVEDHFPDAHVHPSSETEAPVVP